VENVTKRSKRDVMELHLKKSIKGSLDRQFDSSFPEIYKLKGGERGGRLTLQAVTAEDRVIKKTKGKHMGYVQQNSVLNGVQKGVQKGTRGGGGGGMGPGIMLPRMERAAQRHGLMTSIANGGIANAGTLDEVDWLTGGAQKGHVNLQMTLPALNADVAKKNRKKDLRLLGRTKPRQKGGSKSKERDVALESALKLISGYGDKYSGGARKW
jgi:hypothetical protein